MSAGGREIWLPGEYREIVAVLFRKSPEGNLQCLGIHFDLSSERHAGVRWCTKGPCFRPILEVWPPPTPSCRTLCCMRCTAHTSSRRKIYAGVTQEQRYTRPLFFTPKHSAEHQRIHSARRRVDMTVKLRIYEIPMKFRSVSESFSVTKLLDISRKVVVNALRKRLICQPPKPLQGLSEPKGDSFGVDICGQQSV